MQKKKAKLVVRRFLKRVGSVGPAHTMLPRLNQHFTLTGSNRVFSYIDAAALIVAGVAETTTKSQTRSWGPILGPLVRRVASDDGGHL